MLRPADSTAIAETKTAIVVGAASGMGKATAQILAREGFALALADIDGVGARRIATELGATGYELDVADEAAVVRFFADAVAVLGGRLDALATPAGVTDTTPFFELSVEQWRRIYDINVVGTFLCIREAARHMVAGGRIVTVASVAGKRGGGLFGTAAYAASKGAVLALSRNAARVLAERGISVNCVVPGSTNTPMLAASIAERTRRGEPTADNLLHRAAEPSEIAEAIAWLLTSRASFVVGESLTIDGGVMLD